MAINEIWVRPEHWLYRCIRGSLDNSGRNGAMTFMYKKAHSSLLEFGKTAYDRFKGNSQYPAISIFISIIPVDRRDKNKFYAKFQLLISLLKHVVIIMERDRNAPAGHDAAEINSRAGKYGIGIRCANKEELR